MATSSLNVAALGRKTLLQAVKLYDAGTSGIDNHRSMAVNVIQSRQQFEELAAYAGPGIPQTVGEYGNPEVATYQQIWRANFVPEKKMLQFRVSAEAFEDEQSGYSVLRGYATDLAAGFHQGREISAANRFMNFANSAGAWAGPDGVAYGSSAHPLEVGTWSNVLAGNPTLSPEAVNDGLDLLMRQPAHQRDVLYPYAGQVVLEVHPSNMMLATEIARSTDRPDTANRAINALRPRIASVIVNPFFTNVEWWCLRATGGRECKRFWLQRTPFQLSEWRYEDSNDSWIGTARERYLFAIMDWRGAVYSFPS